MPLLRPGRKNKRKFHTLNPTLRVQTSQEPEAEVGPYWDIERPLVHFIPRDDDMASIFPTAAKRDPRLRKPHLSSSGIWMG